MSSLWTPSGEHEPAGEPREPEAPVAPGAAPTASDEELAALRELHHQILATPIEDLVANHVAGLIQLALIHLGIATPPDDEGRVPAPDLAAAGLAIDAISAIVDGLGTRLGAHEGSLREALAQLQTAYVRMSESRPDEPS